MMSYEETMAWGAAQYKDILDHLREVGLPAVFTQTGGICAAIQVQLETGRELLITDAEDSLSWVRAEQRGWGVGLYASDEHSDGALRSEWSDDRSTDSLLGLIRVVLLP